MRNSRRGSRGRRRADSRSLPSGQVRDVIPAGQRQSVADGYNNLVARLGAEQSNPMSASYYTSSGLTARWQELTTMYREGWLTKKIVDMPAEDMTKAWISIDTQLEQSGVDAIEREMRRFKVQKKVTDAVKWARLYGGSIAIILIDGDEDMMDRPLDLTLVMPGSFRGLIIKDRWDDVEPSMELVTDMLDPDYGFPESYRIGKLVDGDNNGSIVVHHSRVLRFVGRELPKAEEESEMYWGASELEHIFDELQKRNSTSANIAQLVFQANLRVFKMSDLGQLLAMSDERTQRELYQTVQAQNMLMTSFGMQVMDSEDSFETHPYSFAGLNDIYQSFQADISGAAEIPATKLFGKSPDGMNSTGDGDLTNYYDSIRQKQENQIREPLEKLLPVVCVSALGLVPDDLEIVFEPVESQTEVQRAALATQIVSAISGLFQSDIISKPMAMKELKKAAFATGIGSVITDEDIEAAEKEAELMAEQNAMGGGMGMMPGGPEQGMSGGQQVPGQAAVPEGQPVQGQGVPEAQDEAVEGTEAVIISIREKIAKLDSLKASIVDAS